MLCLLPFGTVGCAGICAQSYQNQLLSSLAQAAALSGGIPSPDTNSSGAKGAAGGSWGISEWGGGKLQWDGVRQADSGPPALEAV